MTTLRDYQSAAVDALLNSWQHNAKSSGLIVLPTGTGKSLVQAEVIRRLAQSSGAVRILAVTHVRELIEQNAAALVRLWPDAPLGIWSAGLGRRDNARIVFGSIASLKEASVIGPRHVVLIDEAHLVSPDGETMYGRLLSQLRSTAPGLLVGGLTATPYRMTSGMLTDGHDGKSPVFGQVVYEAKLADMIASGWLAPVTSRATATRFNLTGVKTRGGEYLTGDLERRVNTDPINEALIGQVMAMASDRRSWLVFAVGHDHASALGRVLGDCGVAHAVILGSTSDADRNRAIAAFRAGRIRALVSVGVLTTGFDAPNVDCIVMARPTRSVGLYVQMLGRGMRKAEGKTNCLVLDFAGNVSRLGPVDEIDGHKSIDDGTPRAHECADCAALISLKRKSCTECGYEFPKPRPKPKQAKPVHAPKLGNGAVISSEADYLTITVRGVRYVRHEKDGRASMRVIYDSEDLQFGVSEFFSITGNAFFPFKRWWEQRSDFEVPSSVDEALSMVRFLSKPQRIRCRRDGKFWKVVEVEFDVFEERAA